MTLPEHPTVPSPKFRWDIGMYIPILPAGGGAAPGNTSNAMKSVVGRSHRRTTCINPEMVVDERVLDELLLVCSAIGSNTLRTDPNTGALREEFVPAIDCLNWLQDLQRTLCRDHEKYRPVSLMLGKLKVVRQKLLPLVVGCGYDAAIVLTICKILVILTKPLCEATKNAGRMTIDVRKGTVDEW